VANLAGSVYRHAIFLFMPHRALALDVSYLRDGSHPGHLFVGRTGIALELTAPWGIIVVPDEQIFELWTEISRLFGFKVEGPL
jgi:hypothetical protein